MLPFSIFILSGVGIVTLTVAKRLEEKKRHQTLVLRAVSRGDERMREIHHKALHHYSHSKDRFAFWFKKQLPLKLRSFWNRFQVYIGQKSVEYLGDVRNSRLLKKSDGISEFFKNISEIEKGAGEINESLQSNNEDLYMAEPDPSYEPVVLSSPEPIIYPTVEKKPRAPRKPASTRGDSSTRGGKKAVRLTVVEEL